MVAIIYRTDGPWGAGKGARLTKQEIDENFYELAQAIANVVAQPGVGIANITVFDNAMTIHLTDYSTLGPFPLPVASFRFRGPWAPTTDYDANDLFTVENGLYFVNQTHTSDTVFNASAGNEQGPYATLIMPFQTAFDIGFFYPAQPGYGIGDDYTLDVDQPMFAMLAVRDFYLTQDLPGSLSKLDVAASDVLEFEIYKNDELIGVLTYAALATEGFFTFTSDVQFNAGDVLKVYRPDVIDDTAYNLTVTMIAEYGTL